MIQWHPLFVQLLRPVVEAYYDIETNVAVGDVLSVQISPEHAHFFDAATGVTLRKR